MHNLKEIRKDFKTFKELIKNRNVDIDIENLKKLDDLNRELIQKKESFEKEKKDFVISKFDLLNTWQGIFLYFLILILSIFTLKRYFILNVDVIEIQNIENKIIEK